MNTQNNKKNKKTKLFSSSSAEGVRWNLSDYYSSISDKKIAKDLDEALSLAKGFEEKYRGFFSNKKLPKGTEVLRMLQEYEKINILKDKPYIFAHLLFSENTQNPEYGKFLQSIQQKVTEISKHLIFINLEWCALDNASAEKIINYDELKQYRHYLQTTRKFKPHMLSEAEEKIINELENTGSRAFMRMFDELQGAAKFKVRLPAHANKSKTTNLKQKYTLKALSEQQTLALLYDPDRKIRKIAAKALHLGLQSFIKQTTYIFNTLVQHHATIDKLRSFNDPMDSRNLWNEIDAKTVKILLDTCEENYTLVQRYYALKAKLLKTKVLYDYDRYAPISEDLPTCSWNEAKEIVSKSYHSFSKSLGQIVDKFFEENWIDAELREGKRGGAFCSMGTPDVHPYILMNYTDKLRDVATLAHELGHGVHGYLARQQGYLQQDTPLTLAETASVFGEMLTFENLVQIYSKDKNVKLALLCNKIEDALATVFRQVCLTRFEQKLHQKYRSEGELTTEQINQIWIECNYAMFKDSVKLTKEYSNWWSYIGHFVHSPFYCYAYAFGELLVLSLYSLYKQQGEKFVPQYINLLSAGGSKSPAELVATLNLDINDPSFWQNGIKFIDEMVTNAENLANEIRK